ncbi:uroporphyrin-III C-methyltransferase [Hysterangium stoloniferum]|nr:uroporphyrin-III C-methyltransferase [Hysterangium stoloniferum]
MQHLSEYPKPKKGASLLLSFRLHARTVVIIGSGKLAASRAFTCLEADSRVVVLGRGGLGNACEEVRWRAEAGEIEWRSVEEEAARWNASIAASLSPVVDEDEAALLSILSSVSPVSFLCVTDTIITSTGNKSLAPRTKASAIRLYNIASQTHRIPTNVTDMPALCDFAFPATHRFHSVRNGEATGLQIGIVTNSKGCRLSSRITREIVARLPKGVGDAVDSVGILRDKAKADDSRLEHRDTTEAAGHSTDSANDQADNDVSLLPSTPNEPVPQTPLKSPDNASEHLVESTLDRTQRRMRWVAQVSEYWPFESLASLDDEGVNSILNGSVTMPPRAVLRSDGRVSDGNAIATAPTHHAISPLSSPPMPQRGRILLLGSGPGHPSLLTLATSCALRAADLVLSDKLVPEAVLNTIPKNVELRIARKFPGNADRAQEELMHAAVEGAQQGKIVVRLKQGDPMLYARASSEIEYFTAKGFPPAVIPGLSSALAAPLAAGIPVTARGVAESVVICTGVGQGGKGGRIPPYERATTVLVLMGVARLAEITRTMVGGGYPDYLPTCIIERGTMPDQRVVRSTLAGIVDGMTDPRVGPQRPPGMMVVGWACLGVSEGVEGVSEDSGEGLVERDLAKVRKWLVGEPFAIKEGLDVSWEGI